MASHKKRSPHRRIFEIALGNGERTAGTSIFVNDLGALFAEFRIRNWDVQLGLQTGVRHSDFSEGKERLDPRQQIVIAIYRDVCGRYSLELSCVSR
ncbi:hypothetical protein V3M58_02295 [Trueperella pyogenes]|uniref:hypothetical protein n=1 Tax=Trueperella pyogenes TaxID=1661 RepID=UPI0011813B20